MIKNGKFCKYHGSEFKVNRDSDGNETENEYRFKKKVKND